MLVTVTWLWRYENISIRNFFLSFYCKNYSRDAQIRSIAPDKQAYAQRWLSIHDDENTANWQKKYRPICDRYLSLCNARRPMPFNFWRWQCPLANYPAISGPLWPLHACSLHRHWPAIYHSVCGYRALLESFSLPLGNCPPVHRPVLN